jgi:hypothetical protein
MGTLRHFARTLAAGCGGAGAAGVLVAALAGPAPPGIVRGVLADPSGSGPWRILVSRNDCSDPARSLRLLGRAEVLLPGPFEVRLPDIGPGAAYVCAWEAPRSPQGVRGDAAVERWALVALLEPRHEGSTWIWDAGSLDVRDAFPIEPPSARDRGRPR